MKKKVLIVDDATFIRFTLRQMLEKNGFEIVAEAENGAVAVQKYREYQPDIITMDITMPELDGVTALKQIKAIDPKARIVMVSAMGQEAIVKEAIINGANYFIVKPFKEEQVLETLTKVLEM
jgi:two-component system chemotaxis response regulator CheY